MPPRDLVAPGGLLWCGYRAPRLDAISHLHAVSARLERSTIPSGASSQPGSRHFSRGEFERAHNVWRARAGGLSRMTALKPLIESTASFLECAQAAALMSVRALAEGDAVAAGRAAFVSSIVLLGYHTYSLALMDSANDANPHRALPILNKQ